MKSAAPKPPVAKAAQPGNDPFKFWDDFFATTKFKTPTEAENSLFLTVSEVARAGRFDYGEAAIKGFLKYHGKDAQPWMYEMLVTCIDSRKGTDPETKVKAERDVKQTIGYAAFVAKKRGSAGDLRRVADMMVLRGFYTPVGDPGYVTSIGELVDLAMEKQPADGYAPLMSINLAAHDKDPKRMGDAADRLLSLGWPGYDEKIRRDVKEQVDKLAEALKADGKVSEAESLTAVLNEATPRDVYVKLTWKGEADIDMSVAEPFGATAQYHNPRTVSGGAIVKNGYGSHPEEVYVCPRGFEGDYTVVVEKIVDYEESKPVLEATLEVFLHEGAEDEQKKTYKVDLLKPQPVVFKLDKGRRKKFLPYVAPAEPAPAASGAKPKDAPKNLKPPAAPRGAPIR